MELVDCDLTEAVVEESTMVRVAFTRCRLTGADLGGTDLTDVRFTDCQMEGAGLRMVAGQRLVVDGCTAPGVDLYRARVPGSTWRACDLTGAESATCSTLADVMKIAASKPLNFEPGSKWAYCQSSINAGGRIVEIVSGMPFQDFLEQKLFAPLGMKDTTFFLRDEQMPRLVKSYRRTQDGQLVEAVNRTPDGQRTRSFSKFPAANGGLFSTAPDYARFCRMLLNQGTLDGKQYLKPESVAKMTSVLSGDVTTGFTPGNAWGLAFCVVREPQGVSAALSPGTFGHGGAHGTQAWIDPVKNVAYVLMVQRANFPNSDASPVRQAFQEAAAQAMKK